MPSPSPSPDCRVAAPEWSRQCGPRRDDASPCCTTACRCLLTAFFFPFPSSERKRPVQPAGQRSSGRSCPETESRRCVWHRRSVVRMEGGRAGRAVPFLSSRGDQGLDALCVQATHGIGPICFFLCERAAGCCSPVNKAAIVDSCLACVWLPRKMELAPRRLDLWIDSSRRPRTRLLNVSPCSK